MSKVLSIINLKGGVGKTTLTVALGEFMAACHGLRVLIMDLDPQTNATVALMDEHEWKRRNLSGRTILHVFRDRLYGTNLFDPQEAILHGVSNVGGGIPGLDLLPSSLDLIDLQDHLMTIPGNGVLSPRPLTILGENMSETMSGYDLVLIDCPPNLGIITQNGLVLSQYYLVPVIPDVLSTYGIPQIVNRINRLRIETGINIEPLGIVINKFRQQSSLHRSQVRILQLGVEELGCTRLFSTMIPENSQSAAAMDFTFDFPSLHHKYGYQAPYTHYEQLTEEVLQYVFK